LRDIGGKPSQSEVVVPVVVATPPPPPPVAEVVPPQPPPAAIPAAVIDHDAVLDAALESLGQAHHRPFSRG
jgi:hypothetical protein